MAHHRRSHRKSHHHSHHSHHHRHSHARRTRSTHRCRNAKGHFKKCR